MSNAVRNAIGALAISGAGLVGIVLREGYTATAVQPLPGDKWTVGIGSTGPDIGPGTVITPPAAFARALRDVQIVEGGLKRCISAPLTQSEYDAITALAYSVGAGAVCASSIPRKLSAGDYDAACSTILDFDKFRDCTRPKVRDARTGAMVCPLVPVRGLTLARQREHVLCMSR